MMSTIELQLVISFITILGAGVSVYVGVRVALAEIRMQQKNHDREIAEIKNTDIREVKERLARLESIYFQK